MTILPKRRRVGVFAEALFEASVVRGTAQKVVVDVVRHGLRDEEREGVVHDALSRAQAIEEADERLKCLLVLATGFPNIATIYALDTAVKIQAAPIRDAERLCSDAIRQLAPYLSEQLVLQAFYCCCNFTDNYYQVYTLEKLAPYLPTKLMESALDEIGRISDRRRRVHIMNALAPRLPKRLLPSAQKLVQSVEHGAWLHLRLVSALLLAPPCQVMRGIAGVVTRSVSRRKRAEDRVAALSIPARLLDWLSATPVTSWFCRFLDSVAYLIIPSQRCYTLFFYKKAIQHRRLAWALEPQLMRTPPSRVLELVRSQKDSLLQAYWLARIAPRVPSIHRQVVSEEALSVASQIADSAIWRPYCLERIAPYLPSEMLGDALRAAASVRECTRPRALRALAKKLTQLPAWQCHELWCETINAVESHDRTDLLIDLSALAPAIFYLGGVRSIWETAFAARTMREPWS